MPTLRLPALLLAFAGLLTGQTWITARVSSQPPGASVTVDGVAYSETAVFAWRVGSAHVLSVETGQYFDVEGARYTFRKWTDSAGRDYGASPTIQVVASASVYAYRAVFDVQYAVDLLYHACDGWSPEACPASPGTIYLNGTGFYKNARVWVASGETVTASAVPRAGWVFAGWENAFAQPLEPVQTFTVTSPLVLEPRFTRAGDVTVASEPAGLLVSVDGAVVAAPQPFVWGVGTTHTLAPVSPQQDAAGRYWFFHSWSNGGAERQQYTVPPVTDRQPITAAYVRGAVVTVLADPPEIKINIDGSDLWPGSNFIWAVGSVHRLSAPEEPAGRDGRRYRFLGWSDGVASAVRDLTVSAAAPEEGQRVVARYERLGRIIVDSSPPGIAVSVAGAECVTPCTLDRPAGTVVSIGVPAVSPLTGDSRLDFAGWHDGAARERSVTFTGEEQRVTATYRTMYRVRALSDPEGGAAVLFDPPADGGYFAAGTQARVTVTAAPGFRFRRWAGDLEGALPEGLLNVEGPKTVVAQLDRVPYIARGGVINAAGLTPVDGVAAGSIIAIYGVHLAPSVGVSPAGPLLRSLAGVTVEVAGQPLPLYFVSPGQINALIPSDFAPGDYTLVVRSAGRPDVAAAFRVVRHAPGVFANVVDLTPYAVALRADGTVVSVDAPARPNETLTVFGTGFGPYLPDPPDGLAVPADALFPLAEPVEVTIGGIGVTPPQAAAAPGMCGVVAITFRVPETAAGAVPLKARVKGSESNTVTLPVRAAP
jgi:uncharacterized protein (TIGR03437 family)